MHGKEDGYSEFVKATLMPAMAAMGLEPVGGYYVEAGFGPRIVGVHRAHNTEALLRSISSKHFKQLTLQIKSLVSSYRTAVLEPVGRTKRVEYVIQRGVWKFIQHFDLRVGRERDYADFVINEYIPSVEGLGFVEVTGGWSVVLGGVSAIMGELTFKDADDVGRMLHSREFRRVNLTLQDEFLVNYQNRILRCTERFDEPKWFRL
jgi:hypothetical protein